LISSTYRKTSQFLLPAIKPDADKDKYDIYPVFQTAPCLIFRGIDTLAARIACERMVIIDGFSGVLFDPFRKELDRVLQTRHRIESRWINAGDYLKPGEEINRLVNPFLGGADPLFGTRCRLELKDFFDATKLRDYFQKEDGIHYIIYGTGASLIRNQGLLIYIDLPKNEVQYRSRAGSTTNFGVSIPLDPVSMYKRYYFVDWIVLGRHRQEILKRIDIFIDGQRPDDITWMSGNDFRGALHELISSPIRARPWFEPGPWGGTWIKDNIHGVNPEVPNYAWSFELITPENGLILESSGVMLEFSFEFLMLQESKAVLGDGFERFGTEFPLRFDFLDTFDGGNLSIQCHPRPDYLNDMSGENFTQEESYYILDTKEEAVVYLGFQSDIDREQFQTILTESASDNRPVEIEKFVQKHPSHKHNLFLIPFGTIHGSGKNNLVLEISTTPYIFTFKMYDWLRADLNGKLRQLNIERGMDNLFFDRKGETVNRELISKPVLIEEGNDWKLYNLPTHPSHIYGVWRYHFSSQIRVKTGNKFHVLNLVEGDGIIIDIPGRGKTRFNYSETFIIPASIIDYTVTNLSDREAILLLAFVK
jgi:mannose-6-phosphate isomerase class I